MRYPINAELVGAGAPGRCPKYPTYPAGHATISGACATVPKTFFNEDFIIPNPVVASADGRSLELYLGGEPLTIGGELNKLAANISFGRNIAGVHWRSDGIEGLSLGEQVAIGILRNIRKTCNEAFTGFRLTRFDETTVTI